MRLILVLDFYYGFQGQFLEKFWKSADVIALVELFFLPWGTHPDIYELRIRVNKHVEKGSDRIVFNVQFAWQLGTCTRDLTGIGSDLIEL